MTEQQKELKQAKEAKIEPKTAPKQAVDDKKIEEYVNDLKRLQAEFENYVKRVEKERTEIYKLAKKDIILKFINIVEDIDRIVDLAKNSSKEDMEKALQMVCKECHKILDSENVKEIVCKGEPDCYKHEVIMHMNCEVPENHIAQIIQKGYTMGDQVIRYAKVAIGGKK